MGAYIKTYALPFFHSRQIYAETLFFSIFLPFFFHFSHFSSFHISPFALSSSIFLPFFQAQICKLQNTLKVAIVLVIIAVNHPRIRLRHICLFSGL